MLHNIKTDTKTMKNYHLNTQLLATLPRVLRMTHAEVSLASGIPSTTWYRIVGQPNVVTVQQLLALSNSLCIPIRKFFYLGNTLVIGKREDYLILEKYKPCSYNTDAVRRCAGPGTATSWRKVAKAIGMHWTSAEASIMAKRPLPVVRLLDFCNAFQFDLFDFLIDNNINPRRKQTDNTAGYQMGTDLHKEIAELRDDIQALSATVQELAEKYRNLLDAHDRLAKRVNINSINIQNFTHSYIGIAAEETSGYIADKERTNSKSTK